MSAYRVHRASQRINEKAPLSFRFDGKRYKGFAGDTLASALIANGVKLIGRSFKYGRPRGIVGHGAEEPNALIQLETGGHTVPDLKATQVELYEGLSATTTTGFPSLNFDLKGIAGKFSRFMPPGFYYKTFMAPIDAWPLYEKLIRKAAGYGRAPVDPDPEFYDHLHHHVDVLVVGGGACGLWAATLAGRAGLKTLLVEEQNEAGGWMLSDARAQIDGVPAMQWVNARLTELGSLPNVTVLTRTTAFAHHEQNLVQALELVQDHLPIPLRVATTPRQRLHKIRAHHVMLATGAIERPLVYGNNDRPGVLTAAAGQTYLNRYGVAVGRKVLLLTHNDASYDTAMDLAEAGSQVTLIDTRQRGAAAWRNEAAKKAGVELLLGYGIAEVLGGKAASGARLVQLDPHSLTVRGKGPVLSADAILSSGGLTSTVHLFCHNNGRPYWNEDRQSFVTPDEGRQGISVAGSVTGRWGLGEALAQTHASVSAMLIGFGRSPSGEAPVSEDKESAPTRRVFRVPDGKPEGHGAKAFVDYQNDVTAADIHLAVRENYRSIEHVKRYTALGFGTDQGKLSNVNGFAIAAEALGKPISEVGTTTYRPAYTPVTFGALAGSHVGDTFDPRRYTAMQSSHVSRGALFETVGQWMRPWYFPKGKETMHQAVDRECLATRNSVGVMDASTLGKIDIKGPDAREFLNRIYSNAWSKLDPGKCRYGLMLDENGMVMDDGVTACIADDHFYMTTTTGGAARVLNWLERWHQTEWPELKVRFTSVTDHWSTTAVVGPKSRDVLKKLSSGIDLSADAFKFMDWREGTVAGVPARVCRISFSGELAYEINVDASFGHYIWEQVMAAGKEFDITPYGTETMHVLRAEKGFIIVGQDTDGSMSPIDLNMAWAVGMKKPFSYLGRRSLSRSDTSRSNRKQLVGLYTEDPKVVLAEGAQILSSRDTVAPADMQGHVTSSYHSAFLGRSIAMAVVKGGLKREGDTVYVWAHGKMHPAKVVSSVFVDPEGVRQHA
ncbi:sarcosine oxidase subunit alpha family protein [Crenobacter sp. SG2305]|uniref:sarcosine oxidase subunit alpha family protein n=1 Tax=Crenobacter oryzisoli TaxID=3056844 RepID=UPI0025AAA26D|nr:sarcosine oxidase subunit alpha family protein [Crenobacter sp. SG2305]MDN0085331.1 sarcosine oxidase subunit alpha family protein [Crenobacter sp. SG2305]